MTAVFTGSRATGAALAGLYLSPVRDAPAGRPWVMSNMVSTVDGSVEVDGSSKDLGGPDDLTVFRALRAVADVVLVGAGTVRAEGYGPPRLPADLRAWRRDAGRPELPRLAVVTGRLAVDPDTPLFTEHRPYVVTTDGSAAGAPEVLRSRAEVLACGEEEVDLARALERFRQDGASVVLSEGGPSLNADLLSAGLLDELCLTVDPRLVGGSGRRIYSGAPGRQDLALAHVAVAPGSVLFLRYLRR